MADTSNTKKGICSHDFEQHLHLPEGWTGGYIRSLKPEDIKVGKYVGKKPEEGDYGLFSLYGKLIRWNPNFQGLIQRAEENEYVIFPVH